MKLRPTVQRLESRDLLSGNPGPVVVPKVDALVGRHRAEAQSGIAVEGPSPGDDHGRQRDIRDSRRLDRLLIGTWYVPAANLLAHFVLSPAARPLPMADQTLFHITSARDGVFSGTVDAYLMPPSQIGSPPSDPIQYTMTGVVTPNGRIRIEFTPTESGQDNITGLGTMQLVNRQWRMTMQMSTGIAPYVIHWAYMTKLPSGEVPPPVDLARRPGSLRSTEWQWLAGTRWVLADTELFGGTSGSDTGVFRVDRYHGGYFWGSGEGPTPFTVVGSITPEGRVFLVLSASGESYTRTGSIARTDRGRWVMRFRSYEGSPAFGIANMIGDFGD